VSAAAPPGLTRTLVRLKLRLLSNRARRSTSARVQLLISSLVALLIGGGLAAGVAAVGWWGDERGGRAVLVLGATLLTLVWVLVPLLTFGTDETLDPSRLILFPLPPRALAKGLLAASLVGPAPAVAMIVCLGAVAGFVIGGGWVVVPAAVLLIALCATGARTLSTILAARLTSRRGRDLTIIVASLFGLAFQGVRFIRFDAVSTELLDQALDVLRWLPPGMLAQSVVDGRAGRLPLALAELVPPAVLIVVLVRVWARALDRSLTVVADGETPRTRRHADTELPLIPARLGWLAGRPWGAVTARELRYIARDPRRKVILLNSVVLGLGLALWSALAGGRDSRSVLVATMASYIAVLGTSAQIGFDGGARWMDVVAGDTARATLTGKNVAVTLQVLPLVAVIATIVAVLTDGWAYLPATVLLALAGLGAGLGTGNIISVRLPVAQPQSQNPFAGRGTGQGCGTSLALAACSLIQNVLLAPVAAGALVAVLVNPAWLVVVCPLAILYGAALWQIGLTHATRHLAAHQPEILATVDPVRAA
jgi:ABC-2 type transport system permease protein